MRSRWNISKVSQSVGKGKIFPPSSMKPRKLAIDVLLPRRTTRFYWVCLGLPGSFQLTPFSLPGWYLSPFLCSRWILREGRREEEKTPGEERKVFITRRPSRPTSWNGDGEGAVKGGCRWMNRGGGGEQDRPKDGVLWGFHGWCSRKFAYRASVTSPLAPAPGHSRLGISPGADLRDNGDHSYGKSDGGVCVWFGAESHLKKLPDRRAGRDIALGFGERSRTSSRSTRVCDEMSDLR